MPDSKVSDAICFEKLRRNIAAKVKVRYILKNGIWGFAWKCGYDNRKYLIFAFAAGLSAHMVKITNYYPTWDSMYAMEVNGNTMLLLGRWFAGAAAMILSSAYDLQWVEGIIALAFWAVTIILILDILDVKKRCYKLLAITLFYGISSYGFRFVLYKLGSSVCI